MHDRAPWRLDPAVSYLDHGAFGAAPEPVLEAQRAWRDRMEADPVRFLARELPDLLDDARGSVAAFLGADPADLVFLPNATTAVSTVLAAVRFRPEEEILVTDHEYNATLNAVAVAAERDGARIVRARIPFPLRDASDALDAILETVTPRTRLALVSHVTSPTGLVLPIAAIVRELDRRGVHALVDGAHAPGMVPVDLGSLRAAFWTGDGHKWLCGPKGAAVLHVRADLRDELRPLVVSHGWNADLADRSRFHALFDWTGTADPSAVLALPAAIRFVGALDPGGWAGLMAANAALARRGRDVVAAALHLAQPAPDVMLASMAALPLPGIAGDTADAEADALRLTLAEEDHIEVAVWGWPVRAAREPGEGPRSVLLRVSAQRYVRVEEYERLADVLATRLESVGQRGR